MINYQVLADQIKTWAYELGFAKVGITDTDLSAYENYYAKWIAENFHGEMDYMIKHGSKRWQPAELVPGTERVICLALNYLPPTTKFLNVMKNPKRAFISRYALGRDYHKVLKQKLNLLTEKIQQAVQHTSYRVFVDSAPVLEKPLAEKAGLGWIGKHSNLLSNNGSSWFFLGEIFTDLPLPTDVPVQQRCGTCRACIDICPTGAIVNEKVVDARRCISYLTIELKNSIPEELRSLIGNRVYGCDDCQLICPWNKFINATTENDFAPRHDLDNAELLTLFNWSEDEFLKKTEGSAIRRIGYERWLRNMAVGLGNAPYDSVILATLQEKLSYPSVMVQEHIAWAIQQQESKRN